MERRWIVETLVAGAKFASKFIDNSQMSHVPPPQTIALFCRATIEAFE